jgi:hypothetical protein
MYVNGLLKSNNLDQYLDGVLFPGEDKTQDCQNLMTCFENICIKLGVSIASEKTEVHVPSLST